MLPTPSSASSPYISFSSSRIIRLYWFCMDTNGVQPFRRATACILANCHAYIDDAPR